MSKWNHKMDGIDHINIYSKGVTELGRTLSNFSEFHYTCEDGSFKSIEGYWYWLRTYDDRLRELIGWEDKKLGKEILKTKPQVTDETEEYFQELIKRALDHKCWAARLMIKKNTLPYTHYYVFNDKAVDAGYKWIVDHIQGRADLIRRLTVVVNRKTHNFDVYIGRGSKWGNPFKIGPDGSREDVLVKYRKWIVNQTELLSALDELRGKVIGCYCKPEACHGDVLAELCNKEIT